MPLHLLFGIFETGVNVLKTAVQEDISDTLDTLEPKSNNSTGGTSGSDKCKYITNLNQILLNLNFQHQQLKTSLKTHQFQTTKFLYLTQPMPKMIQNEIYLVVY